jgi:C4-dicarboxylate transporter DctM subunit
MSSTAWLLSAGFGALMLLGVPFAFAIGIVVALSLLVNGIEPMLLPQTVVAC